MSFDVLAELLAVGGWVLGLRCELTLLTDVL